MFLKIEPVYTFFTPTIWTAYIVFVDGLLWKHHGSSLFRGRRNELFKWIPLSIGCWLIFEAYNLRLENWRYVNLPEQMVIRLFGYAWSFATIFPAIFLTAELVALVWKVDLWKPIPRQVRISYSLVTLGVVLLIVPLIVPKHLSVYLFGMVWLGFICLLDPLNAKRTGRSLIQHMRGGERTIVWSLLVSGMVCGVLWEFWNFWAGAKWVYTFPILQEVKIFEMPILGYLGFPPFALECFAMYEFFSRGWRGCRG